MLEMFAFSMIGTILFALIAMGLVWLLASLGDGQRVRIKGGAAQASSTGTRRPRRSASQRARR